MIEYRLFSIGSYTFTVAMLIGLLVVWLLAVVALRAIRRVIKRGAGRFVDLSETDKGRRLSLYLLAKYIVWTVAVAVMFEIVGIRVSVVLAGSTALLVGLGLGLQQIFRDIASGVFLLFEGTIEIGDVIQIDGKVGRVEEISLRTSKILTRDGHTLLVPNHKFITENVRNWTHRHQLPSAFSVNVRVAHKTDERLVIQLLKEAISRQPDIIRDSPEYAPEIQLADFLEKATLYEVEFWTLKKFEAAKIQSNLRFAIQQLLRENDIAMSN